VPLVVDVAALGVLRTLDPITLASRDDAITLCAMLHAVDALLTLTKIFSFASRQLAGNDTIVDASALTGFTGIDARG